jgi:two-component system heavy metal sensor histidine kinase CusS
MSSKNGREERTAPPEDRAQRRPWSLSARLTAWYAVSAFTLVLAVAVLLHWALVRSLHRDRDRFLADEVQILRGYLTDRPEDTVELKREVEWESPLRRNSEIFIRIRDESGRLVAETPGMGRLFSLVDFPSPTDGNVDPGHGTVVTVDNRSFQIVSAQATVGRPHGPTYTLQVAMDRTEEENLLAEHRRLLGLVLTLAFLVCVLGGYALAHRGIQPVRQIAGTALGIHSATLSERITLDGLPAELADLASAFNAMLDRLEESFTRLGRFSADIAHELRTPLNNLRGVAEVALRAPRSDERYREVLGSCLEECARLSRLVDRLLFLARAEGPDARITRARLNVGRELTTIREFYEAAAFEVGVSILIEANGLVEADLDRTLFQRAVGNLIENALAHTGPDGTVTLRVMRLERTVRVEVVDTGRGIPEQHLPSLCDRFYRADPSRTTTTGGVGLGLAIVKSIAELHGGSVTITSVVDRGTCVALHFPEDVIAAGVAG